MTNFPFAKIALHLKYIDFQELDPKQKAALEFGFGGFFSEEQPNEFDREFMAARHAAFREKGLKLTTGTEPPFRYRRFAGDATLPRGRYYSLCDNSAGDDHGTLVHELIAYTEHEKCGRFQILDLADPNAFSDPTGPLLVPTSIPPMSITLTFLHDSKGGSPLVEHLADSGLIDEVGTTHIIIPYAVRTMEMEYVLDLRETKVQAWLYDCLKKGIPRLAYQYGGGYVSGRLLVTDERPEDTDVDFSFWNPDRYNKVISYAPCDSWDQRTYVGPDNFLGVLPYLIFPTKGGSPITDAIGRWLRRNGADALIYPSARNDVTCEVEGGQLTRATGWNLVDYRGAPSPRMEPYLVIAPDSWRFAGDVNPYGDSSGGIDLQVRRYDVRVAPPDGPTAGSWRVVDQAKLLRIWFFGQQHMTLAGSEAHRTLEEALKQASDDRPMQRRGADATPSSEKRTDWRQTPNQHMDPAQLDYFVLLNQIVKQSPEPRQRIEALLAMRKFVLEYKTQLEGHPTAQAIMGHPSIELFEWKIAFSLGSTYLFSFQGDRGDNVEEAVRWLRSALDLPVRELSPIDWARTEGELATAYKNRMQGDPDENRDNAMDCFDRALEVFTPKEHLYPWLVTIKQRAITRIEMRSPGSDTARGEDIERAIAELQFVSQHVDRKTDFELWSGTKLALGGAFAIRQLGYFVNNAERSREILEDVLAEAGDLETMLREGATIQRLQTAASTCLHLSRAYQIRRHGDPKENRNRAEALLKSARPFFEVINRQDALQEIDQQLEFLNKSTDEDRRPDLKTN